MIIEFKSLYLNFAFLNASASGSVYNDPGYISWRTKSAVWRDSCSTQWTSNFKVQIWGKEISERKTQLNDTTESFVQSLWIEEEAAKWNRLGDSMRAMSPSQWHFQKFLSRVFVAVQNLVILRGLPLIFGNRNSRQKQPEKCLEERQGFESWQASTRFDTSHLVAHSSRRPTDVARLLCSFELRLGGGPIFFLIYRGLYFFFWLGHVTNLNRNSTSLSPYLLLPKKWSYSLLGTCLNALAIW